MDAVKIIMDAQWRLEVGDITREQYEELIAPLRDVEAVVRCGKCNFWDRNHISCEGLAKCCTGEGGIRYRSSNDFCSKGRKRDGGNHEGRQQLLGKNP